MPCLSADHFALQLRAARQVHPLANQATRHNRRLRTNMRGLAHNGVFKVHAVVDFDVIANVRILDDAVLANQGRNANNGVLY